MKNLQPDLLDEIMALRPKHTPLNKKVDNLKSRMTGAVLGRFAGCMLGIPVENHPVENNIKEAKEVGMEYPPLHYWDVRCPWFLETQYRQYRVSPRVNYADGHITHVPVDDDITYTIMNMLILEKYGFDYTVEDVGEMWLNTLPYACTAEKVALENINNGIPAKECATDPTYLEWIGAAIRADAFGYAMAGRPEKAARLAYNDAYFTHRKNGIYGEMFIAASIASAFVVETPLDAIKEGMKEIPEDSELYQALLWALSFEGKLKTYDEGRRLIDEHFGDMNCVHTINNMCAIVFALILGGKDYTRCISQCVGMGLDNDCTGATVGSIVGANIGIEKIDNYWYKDFNDTVLTYIKGYEKLSLNNVIDRMMNLYQLGLTK